MDDEAVWSERGDGPARIAELKELTRLSRQFGTSLTDAFARGAVQGRGLDGVLRGLGDRLSQIALRSAFRPVEGAIGSALDGLAKAAAGAFGGTFLGGSLVPSAKGNAFGSGRVLPFADGGVVAAPTYFPLGRDTGLMGEAGAEAVLPLARGPDGRLGVRAGGGDAPPVAVTVNIATQDVASFRRAEGQVASALARAVARGRRAL